MEFEFVSAPFTGKGLIEVKDISFSFEQQDAMLIDGLNLTIGKKDRIAVIGKNGKGKTTLLNLLARELYPLKGEIIHHQNLKPAYFGQTNIQRLDFENTVEEEILDAMPVYNRGAARTICGIMMFEGDAALKKVKVLSGGEKSRVLLGKIIVSPANLLLLDEPTNHLDMESVDSLLAAIEAFEGAVVIVTHSEMILNVVFYGVVYYSTFAPALGNETDPCFVGEGTGRLYALKYKTGASAFNLDTTNDLSGTVLSTTDRSIVVGTAIPSGVVITVMGGTTTAYIGVGGGVFTPELPNASSLVRINWRIVF